MVRKVLTLLQYVYGQKMPKNANVICGSSLKYCQVCLTTCDFPLMLLSFEFGNTKSDIIFSYKSRALNDYLIATRF